MWRGLSSGVQGGFSTRKPVKNPRPPISVAALAPATMERVARLADGWIPAGVPLGAMEQMFAAIKRGAAEAGRDPGELKLIVIANIEFHPALLGEERPIFVGSAEQIEEDIVATQQLGAEELIFNAQFSPGVDSVDGLLSHMEQLWTMTRRAE